jgi:acrylyl-CoA reductase (NADPH)
MTDRALTIDQNRATIVQVAAIDASTFVDDVVISVEWSGCNFKDAMVTVPGNRVARKNPLIGGVDLAGTVTASQTPTVAVGAPVIVHGYGLGVEHDGGFSTVAAVPANWVVNRPLEMTARTAMAIGTAGFTAFASVQELLNGGATPESGPILVTGATGGVGSWAVALLASHGFEVVASSGKASSHEYLRDLGAARIIGRDAIDDRPERVLASEIWAGAVDCVGGATLAAILRSLAYGATVAASGLTGGAELATTVYPFITRGVRLCGIDAVEMPLAQRQAIWDAMATPEVARIAEHLTTATVGLEGVPTALDALRSSSTTGRTVVDLSVG